MTMSTRKRMAILYWVLILLVLLPTAGSGIPELLMGGPQSTVATLHTLGYPLYLMKILGLAKILGAAAILANRSRTLKEWAYAGFAFDLLGATASHLLAGDAAHAPLPFVLFLILMAAYRLDARRGTDSAA
jgi:hypothetical protein